ncbi:MAG: PAS domain S-box protein [Verrucomicrobiota bacterium]
MKSPTRILIVEDETAILELFTLILQRNAYEVHTASNGQQARALAPQIRPDLILLDVCLPDTNGVELCAEFKSHPQLADVFVALCSAEARTPTQKAAGLERGADDYLIKPISAAELLARVRNLERLRDTTVALRANARYFRQLVEILPDAVISFDRAGTVQSANSRASQLLGYPNAANLIGRQLHDFVPPAEQGRLPELLTASTNKLPQSLELHWQKHGGRMIPVQLSVAPMAGDHPQTQELVMVIRDLTIQQRAEARQAAFALLGQELSEVDTVRGAAQIIVDIADRLLGWDACHVSLLTPNQAQIIPILAYTTQGGQHCECPLDSIAQPLPPLTQQALTEGPVLGNSQNQPATSPQSEPRLPCRLIALIRKGTTPLGFISLESHPPEAYQPTDLKLLQTLGDHCGGALERIRLSESLRESEGRFRSLFEAAPIGLAIHDAAGHFLNANEAYQDMLGYTEKELQHFGVKGITVPEDVPEGKRLYEELCAGDRNYYRRQKRYQHRDGRVVWADSSAAAVRDHQGQLRLIVSMVDDITTRKQTETAIRQLTENLEQRVRERTQELQNLNQVLLQKEQHLRLTLEASHAGTWSWNALTNESNWDVQYHNLYNLPPHEPPSFAAWIRCVHEDDRDRLLARIAALQASPQDNLWNEEFRANVPGRGERWMAGMGQVIRDSSGKLIQMLGINLDITPRKQAEAAVHRMNELLEQRVRERTAKLEEANQALRESENRFRQLAANVQEVFWISDPRKSKVLYVSPGYERVWGQSCASLVKNPKSWISNLHPEDRERVQAAARDKQIIGDYDEQYRIVRPDGAVRWIRDRAYPVRNAEGAVERLVGVAEDVTERKLAADALRDSETRKRAIMESALDAIITTDAIGRILETNPATERMFGHNKRRLLQQSLVETLIAPSLREWWRHGFQTGFTGEASPQLGSIVEMNAVRAGGLGFPIELTITQIEVSGNQQYTAFIRDITVKRRHEEQIRLLADAVESTQELVSVANADFRLTFVNQAFQETYGYTEDEILGQTAAILYSNSQANICAAINRDSQLGGWQGEAQHRRKDGSEFPVALSTSLIRNHSGEVAGYVGVARDISERKRIEKQNTAFSLLSQRLNGVSTAAAAAATISEVASILFNWDAAYIHVLHPEDALVTPILTVDTIDGRRQDVLPSRMVLDPSPLMKSVLKDGARLINRPTEDDGPPLVRFGDTNRRSASLMFAPIHSNQIPIGIISLQSYARLAFSPRDLQLLQILANHCGDALHRIEVTEALRAAEAKYRSIFENALEGIFQSTPDGRYLSANPAQARILGYESPAELISAVQSIDEQTYVSQSQRKELKRLLETDGQVHSFEAERWRKDGSRIWTSINGRAVRDAQGTVRYYECTSLDITQRRQAELELRRLPHLILEAQEVERQRVARELHDGVNQLLAAAKMRLYKVREGSPELNVAQREILSRCEHMLVLALEENRRIAHNLRPADLDYLGLATTCRNFCRELASQSNLSVTCRVTGLKQRLPAATELNLFRILQEATNNIQKHARAKSVHVALTLRNNTVLLKICDDGRGFDIAKIQSRKNRQRGAGLTNMRERAAGMGGTCEWVSKPSHGTTITVRVPTSELEPDNNPNQPAPQPDKQMPTSRPVSETIARKKRKSATR